MQKRVSDPLKLELHLVVSCICGSLKELYVLLTIEHSLQPIYLKLLSDYTWHGVYSFERRPILYRNLLLKYGCLLCNLS